MEPIYTEQQHIEIILGEYLGDNIEHIKTWIKSAAKHHSSMCEKLHIYGHDTQMQVNARRNMLNANNRMVVFNRMVKSGMIK